MDDTRGGPQLYAFTHHSKMCVLPVEVQPKSVSSRVPKSAAPFYGDFTIAEIRPESSR